MKISKEIKTLWRYLRKYKKKVYFIISIALFSSAISAFIPYIYGKLVDLAIKPSTELILILKILGAWLFLTLISNWVNRYVDRKGSIIGAKSSNDLVLEITYHILKLPMGFHKEKRMGEILQRVGRASDYFESIVNQAIFDLIPGFLRVIVALVILALVEWHLSLAIFVMIILYLAATFIKTKSIIKTQRKMNKAYEKGFGDLYNSTLNIGVVKSSVAENIENKRNAGNFDRIVSRVQDFMNAWLGMSAWQQTILGFGFVFVFGLGIIFLRENIISAGVMVMFIGYTSLVIQPISQLSNNYRMIKRGMVVIERALKLLKVNPEKYAEGKELKQVKGEVAFENVSFKYKKKQMVLKDVNFTVNPGEVVALVGESGVGKTTMMDLLSRYIDPIKGKILIDGCDIQEVNLHSLRKNIAIVPQEISLFNDTVKNNIIYGKRSANMKKIIEVSQAANAHEFIMKLPKKYEQLVGERGVKLSTGQKQRIAIARALLRDPKILILDEATSALDSVSEKLVQEALKRLIKGRTTFIIAHRLSTISHSDKIFVIKKGEIVERGSHQKLMRIKNGIYRNFYLMQSVFKDDLLDGKKA
jgi:ABC-type multidrug transport system fused ATPase/permease subunit